MSEFTVAQGQLIGCVVLGIAVAIKWLKDVEARHKATEEAQARRYEQARLLRQQLDAIPMSAEYRFLHSMAEPLIIVLFDHPSSDSTVEYLKQIIAFKQDCYDREVLAVGEEMLRAAVRYNMRGGIHIPGIP